MKDKQSDKPRDGGARESRAGASLRTILDSMVEAVYVTDERGRVILANAALEALIARDVRGQRAKNVIKSKELKLAIRRARKKNEATEVELETVVGDRMRTFQAQVAPLPEGAGVVTVLHDVTSLKNADRVRRDFVANASHELRTPLTAIRGFAETLRDGALDDRVSATRFVDAILRHTARLERLAADLTALARAEAPQHDDEVSPTDVGAVCRESIASLESAARAKRIRIVVDMPKEPVLVTLSWRSLEHVLINLVDNAVKYSPPESVVRVTVSRDPDHVLVEVRDQGAGIPAKYHERVFERFYRVDKGRSREEGGTGLGLSIVRHLVQRMGGTIELESQPDVGSVFRVRLPVDIEPSREELGD